MSAHEYRGALELLRDGHPFYSLVMAAMMSADTENAAALREAFPATYAELDARYHAPGGLLPNEPGRDELDRAREALGIPPA